jgi:hypothetical protein
MADFESAVKGPNCSKAQSIVMPAQIAPQPMTLGNMRVNGVRTLGVSSFSTSYSRHTLGIG